MKGLKIANFRALSSFFALALSSCACGANFFSLFGLLSESAPVSIPYACRGNLCIAQLN